MTGQGEKQLCIDLCSGLGGFSEAFVDAGWDVVRIDIERRFKPTIQADVCNLPLRRDLVPDVLLASPPCNHFSTASLVSGWPRKGIQKAMEIVGACFEAVAWLKPRYWMIENPRGMLRVMIGKGMHTIHLSDYGAKWKKPTDLWGDVPLPLVASIGEWQKAPRQAHFNRGNTLGVMNDKLKPEERAKMPYGLSQAILEAVTTP